MLVVAQGEYDFCDFAVNGSADDAVAAIFKEIVESVDLETAPKMPTGWDSGTPAPIRRSLQFEVHAEQPLMTVPPVVAYRAFDGPIPPAWARARGYPHAVSLDAVCPGDWGESKQREQGEEESGLPAPHRRHIT